MLLLHALELLGTAAFALFLYFLQSIFFLFLFNSIAKRLIRLEDLFCESKSKFIVFYMI